MAKFRFGNREIVALILFQMSIHYPLVILYLAAWLPLLLAAGPAYAEELTDNLNVIGCPILKRGENALFRVYDSQNPARTFTVSANGKIIAPQANGKIWLPVPEYGLLSFSIADKEKKLSQISYGRTTCGFLACETLAQTANKLAPGENKLKTAQIIFAPAVIEPGKLFLLFGNNLFTPGQEPTVLINNSSAEIVAASQLGIVARAPLSLMPANKQTLSFNKTGSETKQVLLDIAGITTVLPKLEKQLDDTYESSPEKFRITIEGTNLPCLVHIKNKSSDEVSLWNSQQQPLPRDTFLVSNGGPANGLNLFLKRKAKSKVEFTFALEADPWWTENNLNEDSSQQAYRLDLLKQQIDFLQKQKPDPANKQLLTSRQELLDTQVAAGVNDSVLEPINNYLLAVPEIKLLPPATESSKIQQSKSVTTIKKAATVKKKNKSVKPAIRKRQKHKHRHRRR
ncbi:MAG: hypothetical protein K2W82_07065 [Candidatus Obscuribacterales bacterium]|nr:hypothetical protein [Candidatus Obscuribacterales bacterium]